MKRPQTVVPDCRQPVWKASSSKFTCQASAIRSRIVALHDLPPVLIKYRSDAATTAIADRNLEIRGTPYSFPLPCRRSPRWVMWRGMPGAMRAMASAAPRSAPQISMVSPEYADGERSNVGHHGLRTRRGLAIRVHGVVRLFISVEIASIRVPVLHGRPL
jgi:hypothetical protein